MLFFSTAGGAEFLHVSFLYLPTCHSIPYGCWSCSKLQILACIFPLPPHLQPETESSRLPRDPEDCQHVIFLSCSEPPSRPTRLFVSCHLEGLQRLRWSWSELDALSLQYYGKNAAHQRSRWMYCKMSQQGCTDSLSFHWYWLENGSNLTAILNSVRYDLISPPHLINQIQYSLL